MTDPAPTDSQPTASAVTPGWADVGVVLAVVLVPAVHNGFTHIVWPQLVPRFPPVGYHETATLAMLAGWAALVFYLIRHSGRPPARFGLVRPTWLDVPWAAGLFLVVWWAGERLTGLFDHDLSLYPAPPVRAWQFALVVAGTLAVGFTEELVWRGYLLTRLEELTASTWQALTLTSLLFGLAHLYQGIGGPIHAAAFGLVCGGGFVVTRRLGPVALAHAGYDLVLATWDC